MSINTVTFPLSLDFFDGCSHVASELRPSLVDILNQLGASSGLGSTQTQHAWDGSVKFFELQPIGHDPGLYTVNTSGTILSGDGGGIVVVTSSWHDPDLGNVSRDSDPIPNNTPNVLNPYSLTFFSDGVEPIMARFEGFGTHPTLGISLYVAAVRSG